MLFAVTTHAERVLFDNGRSEYAIVLSGKASSSEKAAAKELQYYINKISGATLPIVTGKNVAKGVYVGYDDAVAKLSGKSGYTADDEGFTYMTSGDNLLIFGGRDMGTAYGVFSFLEQMLGVHWYANDFTKIPTQRKFVLPDLSRAEKPAFESRHVLYYQPQQFYDWNIHNLTNTHYDVYRDPQGRYAAISSIEGGHTFGEYITTEEFFGKHPEYFSLRDGRRQREHTQLCLSNRSVIKILSERVVKRIGEKPGYFAYSVTQNDNQSPCQCASCKKIADQYGGQSGLMIWAVNQVADAVAKKYPEAKIITFAYQYTRSAPKGIRPRDNVYVRLCDIECCFAHPLTAKENSAFLDDMCQWASICKNIYIFDYITGFYQFLAPFPNFNVMADNLRTFRSYGVKGVMEEGQYKSNGGEFAELKQWVAAKLLWNPSLDEDSLARIFINDYYGSASQEIWDYFNLCKGLVKSDTHLYFNTTHKAKLYASASGFVSKAEKLVEKALKKTTANSATRQHVEDVQMQVLYLKNALNHKKSLTDGTTRELLRMVEKRNIQVTEDIPAATFVKKQGYI